MQKLLVVARSCLDEKLLQVFCRQIIEALYLSDRGLSSVSTDRCGKPLHSLLIDGGIGKNITRASQRKHSVALELSPNLNTLAGAPSGETEHEQ